LPALPDASAAAGAAAEDCWDRAAALMLTESCGSDALVLASALGCAVLEGCCSCVAGGVAWTGLVGMNDSPSFNASADNEETLVHGDSTCPGRLH
jgi:hypothetical protein